MMTTRTLLLSALMVALGGTAALASAAADPELDAPGTSPVDPGPYTAEEQREARQQLDEQLAGLTSRREIVMKLGTLGLVDRRDGALGELARSRFWGLVPGADSVISLIYQRAPDVSRIEILDEYRERWQFLGQGTSTARRRLVRKGLHSDNPDVRRAAAKLTATRPFPHMVHHVIDAAVVHPELTLAAVLAVARNGDHQGCRWSLEAGAQEGGAVRRAALMAFRRAGPACKERIIEYLHADDPKQRLLAAEGMLHLATIEDASRFREWSDRWQEEHPEMAERLRAAAEALEQDLYDRPPELPPVDVQFTWK